MKKKINESLPALIPEYPVTVAGQNLTLRFDVNVNKTKKGVKLQFVLQNVPEDPRKLQDLANEIGTELQEKFGAKGLQIIYDVENPYKNLIGFLLPLPSLADFIMKNVLKGQDSVDEPEELPSQEEPPSEVPAEEEPVKEIFMKRAGIK